MGNQSIIQLVLLKVMPRVYNSTSATDQHICFVLQPPDHSKQKEQQAFHSISNRLCANFNYDAQNISAVERGLLTCIYWWLCCTWQLEAIVSKKELALLPHYVRARFDSSTIFFSFFVLHSPCWKIQEIYEILTSLILMK